MRRSLHVRTVVSLVAFLALPLAASAQFDASGAAFTLSASPLYPSPYGSVSVTPLSSEISLSTATMNLSVNGKEIYRGPVQTVSVPLGGAGSAAEVRAVIYSGGASYVQTLTLVPQEITLIIEPLATVPPLYPGKASIPMEGKVRIVALANLRDRAGNATDPAKLAYTWTVDGVRLAAASGMGKSVLQAEAPLQYRNRSVSVVVQSEDGALTGGASYSFTSQSPTVRIYENDPLLGIRFDRALGDSYAIRGAETSLYGAPFSFPTTSGALVQEWFVSGERVQTGPAVTLRPTGDGAGTASLSYSASASDFARAAASLSLSFGTAPGFSFFGL